MLKRRLKAGLLLAMGDHGGEFSHLELASESARAYTLKLTGDSERLVIARDETPLRSLAKQTSVDSSAPRTIVEVQMDGSVRRHVSRSCTST